MKITEAEGEAAIAVLMAQPNLAPPADGCGELVKLETHDRATTRLRRMQRLRSCKVGEPRDFVEQEAEVVAGIDRFIGGGVISL